MVGLDLILGGRQTTTLGPSMAGLGLASGAGGGVDPLALLRPISYIKAVPNEYNSAQGLGAGVSKVGGTYHGVAYDDITDGSFQAWFPHYAASAGFGEWSTGGTLTGTASVLWIDNSGNVQITTMNADAPAAAFQDFKLRHPGVRPKVGSHFWVNWLLNFTNSGYYSHGRADYANGEGLMYGVSTPNNVGTSTLYGNTYAGAGDYYGPSFVGGNLLRTTAAVSGDSNTSGVLSGSISDIPDTLQGAIGATSRLLLPFMALMDVSIPGATASEMADPTKTVCRDRMMKLGGTGVKRVYPLGTNDILFQGGSSAQVKADIETAMARHGENPSTAYVHTITPVITSASSNTIPNAGREAVKQTENARRRALANVIDFAVGVESGLTGLYQRLADEIDGTHLSTAGNKNAVAGASFNVATKLGVAALNAGFQYPSGQLFQTLDFSGWSGQQATLQTRAAYAPEHKFTAAIVKEDATAAASHDIFSQQTIALASTTKTITCFLKRVVGARNAQVQVQGNGGSFLSSRVWVNLATGAVALVEQGAGTVSAMASALQDDGSWKVSFNVAFGASHPASSFLYAKLADSIGSDNFNGDNTSSIAVWGFDIR